MQTYHLKESLFAQMDGLQSSTAETVHCMSALMYRINLNTSRKFNKTTNSQFLVPCEIVPEKCMSYPEAVQWIGCWWLLTEQNLHQWESDKWYTWKTNKQTNNNNNKTYLVNKSCLNTNLNTNYLEYSDWQKNSTTLLQKLEKLALIF